MRDTEKGRKRENRTLRKEDKERKETLRKEHIGMRKGKRTQRNMR
jgi:hypothetical protein